METRVKRGTSKVVPKYLKKSSGPFFQ